MKYVNKWYNYYPYKGTPEIGVEVLFSNDQDIWIGMALEVSRGVYMVYIRDDSGHSVWSARYSRPKYWRNLPNPPEKENPKDKFRFF